MKVYTKTGDKGTTSLIGGKRVPKNSLRLEAYGGVDELNSHMGMIRSYPLKEEESRDLLEIQKKLFDLGGYLATDPDFKGGKPGVCVTSEDLSRLEAAIDRMDVRLPQMTAFVIPGGHPGVSAAHIARTVCRRGGRRILDLAEEAAVDETAMKYINRLSDYLFVLARKLAQDAGVEEVKWLP